MENILANQNIWDITQLLLEGKIKWEDIDMNIQIKMINEGCVDKTGNPTTRYLIIPFESRFVNTPENDF